MRSASQSQVPDVVPTALAVIDREGIIRSVNEEWRRFAAQNDADPATLAGLGLDYLAACGSDPAADRIRRFVAGDDAALPWVYSCHAPTQLRWFRLSGHRLPDGHVALIHADISREHVSAQLLRVQAELTSAMVEVRPLEELQDTLLHSLCERLEWDWGALWRRDERGTWSRERQVSRTAQGQRFMVVPPEPCVGHGSCLVCRAAHSGRPEWLADLSDAWGERAVAAGAAGLRSGLALPLRESGKVVAVLELYGVVRRDVEPVVLEMLGVALQHLEEYGARRRAERAADEAREFLRAVLKDVPPMVAVLDREGRIVFINRLQRRPLEQVIGSSWLEYLPPEHHPRMRASLEELFRTGSPSCTEGSVQLPNGQRVWFSNQLTLLRSGGAEPRAILLSQDVTENKRLQQDLMSADRLAAIGTLAAGVAHEINTPIQFVSDSIHFLQESAGAVFGVLDPLLQAHQASPGGGDPERAARIDAALDDADLEYVREALPRAFDRSVEGLKRVAEIVRSMKEFSRADQQQMEPADLNRAIENTLVIARSEYKDVADVETELSPLPPVVCHLGDINRVVLNLVVNASHAIGDVVKGSATRGRIQVKTALEDAAGGAPLVRISVSDTGTGIPEHVQPRVFEPFFTTKEVGRGTGQGLAMAWSIVQEKHMGSIGFETTLGRGTTFHVRLPVHGPPRTREGDAPAGRA